MNIHMHMCVAAIREEKAMRLKKSKRWYKGGLEGGKLETEIMQLYYNHKIIYLVFTFESLLS